MKVVILGSGSFAGQTIFSKFLERGYKVIGINRSSPKDIHFWPWVKNFIRKENWFEYNLLDDSDKIINVIKKFKPEVIIDLMGQGMVAPSWKDPELWYQTNISSKSKIIQSFLNLDSLSKYIRASTPEVYGSSASLIKESSFFNPSTPYAVSHSAIDMHLRCLGKQYQFPYLIGRFANFYGQGQQLYRVIPKLFLSCLTKKNFTLDGGGKSTRYFIHSNDILSAFDKLIDSEYVCSEFNFSGNEEVSISELVDMICKITNTNRDQFVHDGPERPGKDAHYRLDCSKSLKLLKWRPEISLIKGLNDVKEWVEKNINELSQHSWNYKHSR